MDGPPSRSQAEDLATAVVADGEAAQRRWVVAVLRGAGWRVQDAADGLGALDLIRALQPAVAVLAVDLGEIDGLAVCWALAHDPLLGGTRVVLTTSDPELIARRHELGAAAHAYLLKPFRAEALLAAVRRLTTGQGVIDGASLGTSRRS